MSGNGNLIGGVIGLGVSFLSGGLISPMWGWMLGSVAGGLLMPPEVPRLEDLRPQASEYGRPIPSIYGTIGIGGNVIWATDLVEGSGGGGKGSEPQGPSYTASFAVLICQSDGDKTLGRIWAGPEKRLIWDGTTLESGELRFYNGAADQMPDPLIESYEGAGNVPAYRGYAYLVLEGFQVGKDGNRIPFLTIEIGNASTSVNNGPANIGQAWFQQVIVTDTRMYSFYFGSYHGVVIHDLTATGYEFAQHFVYPGAEWDESDSFFVDEDNDRIVFYAPGGLLTYATIDTTTGVKTSHTISAPLGADSDLGTAFFGGCYRNGKYILASRGAATGRVGLWVIDPATHTAEAAYAADTGSAYAAVDMHPPKETSGITYVFVVSPDRVTSHALTSSTAVTSLGAASGTDSSSAIRSGVDPYTGYLWTATIAAGTLKVTAHSPTLGLLVTHGPFATDLYEWAWSGAITFTPAPYNTVILSSNRAGTGSDVFHVFDSGTLANIGQFDGGYHGTVDLHAVVYNGVRDELLAIRYTGIVTVGQPDDPRTLNYLQAGTFTTEEDNWYIAQQDVSSAVLLAGQPLSEVVADLCERAGLQASQYDVTALTDTVDGYALANSTSVRDAIAALAPIYYFDPVESGGKVKFVKRGGAIAAVIGDDELGAYESGGEAPDDLTTVRQMENELPRVLSVKYLLAATDYGAAAKESKRLVGSSGEEAVIEVPMVLTDTKGQEVADVNLHQAWVARLTYGTSLPRKYAYLEPTDIVVIKGHTMRIKKMTQKGGRYQTELVHDDSNIYTPNVIVTETPPRSGDDATVDTGTDTTLELM